MRPSFRIPPWASGISKSRPHYRFRISDHGCHFKTRNDEYKRSPHDSSVWVPFAVWGPGWNGGGERPEAVSLVDLLPSLLDSADIDIPVSLQGHSLLPLARNEPGDRPEESLIQFGDGWLPSGRALRTPRWKYAVTAPDSCKGQGEAPEYTGILTTGFLRFRPSRRCGPHAERSGHSDAISEVSR
ncbi:MAG: hypothetical protein WD708_07010 [Kiritimatiellia bacterium]